MLQLQTTHTIKHTHTSAQCGDSEHKLIGLLETLITLLSHMSFMQSQAQTSTVGVTRMEKSSLIGPKSSLYFPNNGGKIPPWKQTVAETEN